MSIWQKFAPDLSCPKITDIPLDHLWEHGIRGILFDLDNTITEWHTYEVPEATQQWFYDLKTRGFSACIVSNNHGQRVQPVAKLLELPCLFDAAKPSRKSYHKAAALLGLQLSQLAMVGDQLLTDILGGNRAGLYTIFVEYIHPVEHWGTVHVLRPLERFVLKRLQMHQHTLPDRSS